MIRPTNQPEWATSGANVLEPSSGKKAAGWLNGEQPPAGHFNWLQRRVYDWVQYLDDIVAQVLAAAGMVPGDSAFLARQLSLKTEARALLSAALAAPADPFGWAASRTRLVCACDSGIQTSDDLGRSWAAGTVISGLRWATFWNDSLFVVGGNNGALYTSPTGVTWTARTSGFGSDTVQAAATRGATIVIVGESGLNARSSDAISFTVGTPLVGTVCDVVADATAFVACCVGVGADRAHMIYRSTTGATWAPVDLTSLLASDEYVEQLEWHAAIGFVAAVRTTATYRYMLVSVDSGVTWVKKGVSGLLTAGLAEKCHLVASQGGLFLISAEAGVLASACSHDAELWRRLPFCVPLDTVDFEGTPHLNRLRILSQGGARVWASSPISYPWIY